MDSRLPKLKLNLDSDPKKFSYLSPTTKRSYTTRSTDRINFTKNGFSSPKCVRASHEMLISLDQTLIKKHSALDSSKSILLNNRRIGEKLLLDSFPSKCFKNK